VKLALIILGNLFSVVGLIAFVQSVAKHRKCRQTKNWIRVVGTITQSESVTDHGNDAFPHVSYEYSIEGLDFVGSNINFRPFYYDLETTKDALKKYPIGKEVDVFIDPNNHPKSVLEPGVGPSKEMLYSHLFSLAFLGFGIILLWLAVAMLN